MASLLDWARDTWVSILPITTDTWAEPTGMTFTGQLTPWAPGEFEALFGTEGRVVAIPGSTESIGDLLNRQIAPWEGLAWEQAREVPNIQIGAGLAGAGVGAAVALVVVAFLLLKR